MTQQNSVETVLIWKVWICSVLFWFQYYRVIVCVSVPHNVKFFSNRIYCIHLGVGGSMDYRNTHCGLQSSNWYDRLYQLHGKVAPLGLENWSTEIAEVHTILGCILYGVHRLSCSTFLVIYGNILKNFSCTISRIQY